MKARYSQRVGHKYITIFLNISF
jgi:protein TIF31